MAGRVRDGRIDDLRTELVAYGHGSSGMLDSGTDVRKGGENDGEL